MGRTELKTLKMYQQLIARFYMAFCMLTVPSLATSQGTTYWVPHKDVDEMSGSSIKSIYTDYKLSDGGSFEVTATCGMGMVNFAYAYFPEHKGDSENLMWQENDSYSGTTFGFSTELSRNVTRWVPIRVRLGEGSVLDRGSSSKFTNEVEVVFDDPKQIQLLADRYNDPQAAGQNAGQAVIGMLQALQDKILPSLMPSIAGGTLAQLEASETLRVQVPLTDGRNPVVIIHPNDPSLSAYIRGCLGGGAKLQARYAGPQGVVVNFKDGVATFNRPGTAEVAMPYTIRGDTVVLFPSDEPSLTCQIGADGVLEFGPGMRLTPSP